MVKKILFLLILLILFISIENKNEQYYTFFKPYYSESNQKRLDLNIYNKNMHIFSTYKEFGMFLNNFIKLFLKNTNLLFIKVKINNNIEQALELLQNNKINFAVMPLCLIENVVNYNNIRYMTNLNKTTLYIVYNSYKHKHIKTINDFKNNTIIGLYFKNSITHLIVDNLLNTKLENNKNFIFKHDTYKNNIRNLLNKHSNINAFIFIDSNPSDILTKIIYNDYNNKIKILNLNLQDFNLPKSQINYIEDYIKFKNPSILYPNYEYKTFFYLNTILTNQFASNKIVYELTKFLINHNSDKNKTDDYDSLELLYKNLKKTNLLTHQGSNNYFKDIGLISFNKNCFENIGKIKCVDNNYG